jgi:hypothetical protein
MHHYAISRLECYKGALDDAGNGDKDEKYHILQIFVVLRWNSGEGSLTESNAQAICTTPCHVPTSCRNDGTGATCSRHGTALLF